jgi:hypothetical protein
MENPKNIPLKTNIDWKFGLITRNIYRAHKNVFYIDETSGGWITALVTLEQMIGLTEGAISLTDLEWS